MNTLDPVAIDAYASMSNEAYNNTAGQVGDIETSNGTFVEIDRELSSDNLAGFQARAFFNDSTNELVIAFAGTEGLAQGFSAPEALPDLVADLGLAVAGVSPQDALAEAFIAEAVVAANVLSDPFKPINVTYTGHSLGGFLAQTASASGPEGEVVVFNSPGAGGFLGFPENHTFPEENFTYIYSDNAAWDPLSAAIHSVGTPLSDNLYIVEGTSGHALTDPTNTATSTALGDVLDGTVVPTPVEDDIFIPIDEALQILGADQLLDLFDDGGGTSDGPIEGTSGADLLTGTGSGDEIFGLGAMNRMMAVPGMTASTATMAGTPFWAEKGMIS